MKRFEQWKTKTEEERILLVRCRDAIREIDPSAEVILYGSVARGNAEPDSDYDLLVLVDGDVSLEKEDLFRRQLFPLELESGKVLTIIVYSRRDWNSALYRAMPFHQNVERDGVIL